MNVYIIYFLELKHNRLRLTNWNYVLVKASDHWVTHQTYYFVWMYLFTSFFFFYYSHLLFFFCSFFIKSFFHLDDQESNKQDTNSLSFLHDKRITNTIMLIKKKKLFYHLNFKIRKWLMRGMIKKRGRHVDHATRTFQM